MDWIEVLNNIILQVVQVALVLAIGYVVNLVRLKTENAKVREALAMVEDAAKRAVTVVTQTYVDEVRKGDGLSKETAAEAFDRAMAEVYMTVNEDALEIATKVTGDIHSYLRQLIEEQVKLQKHEDIIREV